MQCPVCDQHLECLDEGHYETLSEHVGNPNGKVSLKDGYGCVNPDCSAHKMGVRWLHDGEGPYRATDRLPRSQWFPKNTFAYAINTDRHRSRE